MEKWERNAQTLDSFLWPNSFILRWSKYIYPLLKLYTYEQRLELTFNMQMLHNKVNSDIMFKKHSNSWVMLGIFLKKFIYNYTNWYYLILQLAEQN